MIEFPNKIEWIVEELESYGFEDVTPYAVEMILNGEGLRTFGDGLIECVQELAFEWDTD